MKKQSRAKTNARRNNFEPVKMMRDIRSKLTEEIRGMTHQEEMNFLRKLLLTKQR